MNKITNNVKSFLTFGAKKFFPLENCGFEKITIFAAA